MVVCGFRCWRWWLWIDLFVWWKHAIWTFNLELLANNDAVEYRMLHSNRTEVEEWWLMWVKFMTSTFIVSLPGTTPCCSNQLSSVQRISIFIYIYIFLFLFQFISFPEFDKMSYLLLFSILFVSYALIFSLFIRLSKTGKKKSWKNDCSQQSIGITIATDRNNRKRSRKFFREHWTYS